MDGPGLSSLAANINFHTSQFDAQAWLQLIIMLVALVLCALASAAETAFTSVNRIKLKNLAEEGDTQMLKIERLLAEPNVFLSTILIVNSVAVVVASSMATVLTLRFFSASLGEVISSVATSLVVLIFCEISPKTAAVQNPLRWARFFIDPVRAAAWVLRPIVWLLSAITSGLVRLLGGQMKHRGPFITEDELRLLVTVGEEEGVLEEEETEMIRSIFEFADTTVREVMVPRIDMVTLPSTATVNQAVDLAMQGGFSRIPVYEASVGMDDILGILYTKDMLRQLRENHGSLPVHNLVRSAYCVPETKKLDDLLRELRQSRTHMAMVIDEYGSVAGLVTIEDLMEEIVGDIQDEYDHEEKLFEVVNENEYIIDAKMSIYDFNELMKTDMDDSDYETLGGFVYAQLDKIPGVGDTITFENLTLTVLATRGRRILKIRVCVKSQQQQEESDVLLLPAPVEEEPQASEDKKVEDKGDLTEQPSRFEYKGA
ncbi:hemolysin family protein [Dictyobacter aurantiacus]|uniref:Gliding motility protein GldE n=1 Tax=Dictyobacter aurantiacus TaxID=1936993 RepID=A0A401Z912_9CHLR|nr:hemolysin family protein [Dictyobacter aurantiacus]GCE03286.1 gliding motility protein GldE [Dictyobacter aurantiacus]